jgi:hypothetical protein
MRLEPPNFIDKASMSESWDESDWRQWRALRNRFKGLSVEGLKLYGPDYLHAENGWTYAQGSVRVDNSAAKPMLDALARLANQLQPPLPGVGSRATRRS